MDKITVDDLHATAEKITSHSVEADAGIEEGVIAQFIDGSVFHAGASELDDYSRTDRLTVVRLIEEHKK